MCVCVCVCVCPINIVVHNHSLCVCVSCSQTLADRHLKQAFFEGMKTKKYPRIFVMHLKQALPNAYVRVKNIAKRLVADSLWQTVVCMFVCMYVCVYVCM